MIPAAVHAFFEILGALSLIGSVAFIALCVSGQARHEHGRRHSPPVDTRPALTVVADRSNVVQLSAYRQGGDAAA